MRITNCLVLSALWLFPAFSLAQNTPSPTKAAERLEGFKRKEKIIGNHILKNLSFHSVGPAIMGGRITDVEVSPSNPNEFYVAYASGGLFHTSNNGQSYEALFDEEMVISIGDIAVDWKNRVIWLGSGENNSSRSSYSGFGIYRSADGGRTWEHKGLEESHHTGRIVLHPTDPKVIFVAALGHLYSPNSERGVYKSEDGGTSWKKVLYIDSLTGAIDLAINPANPGVLYTSVWKRERTAWNFTESGNTSGIYRSDDGGNHWKKVTNDKGGFPSGDGLGRIGLAISNDGSYLYAMLDNQTLRPPDKLRKKELSKADLKSMSGDEFLKLENAYIKAYLEKYDFPPELNADTLKVLVKNKSIEVRHLVEYVEDANRDLFETEVTGAEVYRSSDGGESWIRSHSEYIDDFVFTYGYYFGQIRVSPSDRKKIYLTGVPLLRSDDAGASFISINGQNQHVDHHALWINPALDGHLINGNDGGLNISYDDGKNWQKVNSPPVGQFYSVNIDMAKPYKIYGGLQDNGVWVGPSTYKAGSEWENTGDYPYDRILGGDGAKVFVDSRDNKTVYTGYQFGHYFRRDGTGMKKISPKHKLGERPLRFNWQAPIHLSVHNQDILYFGSNRFHRSFDRGNNYDLVSGDLTGGGIKGDVAFGTLTCIHESSLRFGLIYAGSDDGHIWRSDDAGLHWTAISGGLPGGFWVSSLQASSHDTGRVYLALNGYRCDNFDALLYSSDDFGRTWKRLGSGLPCEPVNTLREDPVNKKLLYVGTDHGLYISIDGGNSFVFMNNGIPAVAVHDLVVHPRERELVVATHGRSLYKADISHIQQLRDSIIGKSIHLFALPSIVYRPEWGKKENAWKDFRLPEVKMAVYVVKEGIYKMELIYNQGKSLYTASDTFSAGMNYYTYDLSANNNQVKEYIAFLEGKKSKENLDVADNGIFYLRPGSYEIKWTSVDNRLKSQRKLIIESNEKK